VGTGVFERLTGDKEFLAGILSKVQGDLPGVMINGVYRFLAASTRALGTQPFAQYK